MFISLTYSESQYTEESKTGILTWQKPKGMSNGAMWLTGLLRETRTTSSGVATLKMDWGWGWGWALPYQILRKHPTDLPTAQSYGEISQLRFPSLS